MAKIGLTERPGAILSLWHLDPNGCNRSQPDFSGVQPEWSAIAETRPRATYVQLGGWPRTGVTDLPAPRPRRCAALGRAGVRRRQVRFGTFSKGHATALLGRGAGRREREPARRAAHRAGSSTVRSCRHGDASRSMDRASVARTASSDSASTASGPPRTTEPAPTSSSMKTHAPASRTAPPSVATGPIGGRSGGARLGTWSRSFRQSSPASSNCRSPEYHDRRRNPALLSVPHLAWHSSLAPRNEDRPAPSRRMSGGDHIGYMTSETGTENCPP